MEKPKGFSKNAGHTKGGHRIYHITIKDADGYQHYLDCPSLSGKMVHIEGEQAKDVPSDILSKKIQQFKTLLEKIEKGSR